MNLKEAQLCLACDEVYSGKQCPKCGDVGASLKMWVTPLPRRRVRKLFPLPRQEVYVSLTPERTPPLTFAGRMHHLVVSDRRGADLAGEGCNDGGIEK